MQTLKLPVETLVLRVGESSIAQPLDGILGTLCLPEIGKERKNLGGHRGDGLLLMEALNGYLLEPAPS